ncbi:MAG: peptidoglycan D,D-transpeptidase FtsI family protein [Bacilli bacterium]|jgi:cell division protein FtsI/penicillin-binding protein 2
MRYYRRYSQYKPVRMLKDIMEKRFSFLSIVIIIVFSLLVIKLYNLQIIQIEYHAKNLALLQEKVIEGTSAPRGRIYDRNYNLLVDNKPVKTIYYKKPRNIKTKEEIDLAYEVAKLIDVPYQNLSKTSLKEFWLINNSELGNKKITDEERKLLKERKLTSNDIHKLKLERITDEDLAAYNELDKEAAYIYYLMNQGYYYDEKIIKNNNVTDAEYAIISENINNFKGFNTKLDWEREYLYGDTFKTILGNVSSQKQGIPYELKNYYLANGYSLNDRVGISYLEYQYEKILKGKKPKYRLLADNSYQLISEGERGNDIVLTIDIKLQQAIEQILIEEITNAKKEPNTEYYNRSFVIISDPKSGEILAMAGKQVIKVNDEYKVYDYTPGIVTSPVVVGSVIKGASIMMGYKYGVIDIGSKLLDECIKIKDTPLKCSWQSLGWISDIEALKWSSNVYQFRIAMAIGKGNYRYNQPLVIDSKAFDLYRDFYQQFGLGVKTGIDLPIESVGYKGSSTLSGHLLDFSMGQYDTYTPIQLSQYISTIANDGYRLMPHLLKEVYKPTDNKSLSEIIYQQNPKVLGKVDVDDKYIKRVQQGFREVMTSGLGIGFMDSGVKPAGKTGTSESFIDTNSDGIVDKETISNAFVGYAPYDDPKMSIAVVSPDVSYPGSGISYRSLVNKRIAARVAKKFFEFY